MIIDNKKHFLIIDSNSVLHRAFHALPLLSTKNGEIVNAVYGFCLVFLKALKEINPSFVAAVFDLPGPTFRHEASKEYKAKRPPTPKELCEQFEKAKEILKAFNVPIFEKQGWEADDLIGTLSKKVLKNQNSLEIETFILTSDSDIFQLVDAQTKVYASNKGLKDTILYDYDKVKEKYQGLLPSQLIDYNALKGDPSDNIAGVPGIGEKTALKLIKEFGTLENLYESIEKPEFTANEKIHLPRTPESSIVHSGDEGLQAIIPLQENPCFNTGVRGLAPHFLAKLKQYKEQAFLARFLVQIQRDVALEFNLENCELPKIDKEKVSQVFEKFEFHALIKRINNDEFLC